MGECASKKEVLEILRERAEEYGRCMAVDKQSAVLGCMDAIRMMKPADVAPVVHGEWLEYGGEDEGFHFCSVCKGQAFNYEDGSEIVEVRSNYCPCCGALMDGRTTPRLPHGPTPESEV